MPELLNLSFDAPLVTTNATDHVFEALYDAIVSFQLTPGTKMSEAEVAKQMDVSRQPVRDAFFRLSELGFLLIRPQRATLVTKISVSAVQQAAFVRTALELACLKDAIAQLDAEGEARLDRIMDAQADAVKAQDSTKFHELDDALHQTLCQIGGRSYVWSLIKEQKAHMDRVRFLSLPFSSPDAYEDHKVIHQAIIDRSQDRAKDLMRTHLSRIFALLEQTRKENGAYFEGHVG